MPKCLYKHAQFEANNTTNSCYKLTTQDTLITANKIKTILAKEGEGEAIDKAIETINKTVQPSRNRVLTTWAKESVEQGNLE